jgi:predicted DNA-binding protein YlxM (UPF0122 family)
MSSITPEILKEWAIREKAYYEEADKWKAVEENMKRQHEQQVADWKQKDEEYEKYVKQNEIFTEIKKYSQQEINTAMQEVRIDRLKELLKEYI